MYAFVYQKQEGFVDKFSLHRYLLPDEVKDMQSDDTMLEANVFSYPEEDQLTNQRYQSRLKKRANTD